MRKVARKYNRHGPLGVALPGAYETSAGWRGPVERRDPTTYQRQTSVGILRCPCCQHWRAESPAVVCGTCGLYSLPLSLS